MSDAQARRKTETIPQWKREEVDEIVGMLESYDSVGVVSITGIPSKQLQAMRRGLHGTAELRVSRNTLLQRSLDEVGLEQLEDHVHGQVGLIGTDDNPFALFRQLEESKTPAPIRAGEVAPNDIVIPEGDTGVEDGQFIGDLKQVGVDSRFQDGAVAVSDTATVLETGEEVSEQLSNVLSTLEMEPKEVGLDLRGVVSDGVLFDPEDLDIDVEGYRADLEAATARANNLAVNAGVVTADTAGSLLSKVESEVSALAVAAGVVSPETAGDVLAAADADVRALAGAIDDDEALPEELRGVEQAPAEEADAGEDDTSEESEGADDADADAGDEDEDDDGDDGDAAAEGLGNMFG